MAAALPSVLRGLRRLFADPGGVRLRPLPFPWLVAGDSPAAMLLMIVSCSRFSSSMKSYATRSFSSLNCSSRSALRR